MVLIMRKNDLNFLILVRMNVRPFEIAEMVFAFEVLARKLSSNS